MATWIVYALSMLWDSLLGTSFRIIDPDTGISYWYGGAFYYVAFLLMIVPIFATTVRRLHDTGCSGSHLLWMIIPIVGSIILLVFLCQKSNLGENKYGNEGRYFV
jgi:uncharacterized membrane protein YhaH (DUF805 family)